MLFGGDCGVVDRGRLLGLDDCGVGGGCCMLFASVSLVFAIGLTSTGRVPSRFDWSWLPAAPVPVGFFGGNGGGGGDSGAGGLVDSAAAVVDRGGWAGSGCSAIWVVTWLFSIPFCDSFSITLPPPFVMISTGVSGSGGAGGGADARGAVDCGAGVVDPDGWAISRCVACWYSVV